MNESRIWGFLVEHIGNPFGAAGMMGNLYAESGLNPRNLQNTFEKRFGFSDDEYTEAVDSGRYNSFVFDGAGYGIAQWTYWSRKTRLLSMAREMGASLLTEELYCRLQSLGEFDLKTSSWIKTPEGVRNKGGALFAERRYGRVFTFHNGADSYYSVRGFRGYILI